MAKLNGVYGRYNKETKQIEIHLYGQERKLKTLKPNRAWPHGIKLSEWEKEIVRKRVRQGIRRMARHGKS